MNYLFELDTGRLLVEEFNTDEMAKQYFEENDDIVLMKPENKTYWIRKENK